MKTKYTSVLIWHTYVILQIFVLFRQVWFKCFISKNVNRCYLEYSNSSQFLHTDSQARANFPQLISISVPHGVSQYPQILPGFRWYSQDNMSRLRVTDRHRPDINLLSLPPHLRCEWRWWHRLVQAGPPALFVSIPTTPGGMSGPPPPPAATLATIYYMIYIYMYVHIHIYYRYIYWIIPGHNGCLWTGENIGDYWDWLRALESLLLGDCVE